MKRKLAVIVASDVADYSRLVADSEEETIARFREAAQVLADLVGKYDGRVFNAAGDAILAEFNSAVSATRCAIDFQDANNGRNAAVADRRRLLFRIGIAIGDVVVAEKGDLLGDGVNIAARLQTLARPGGICISQDVRTHVSSKVALGFVDLGEQTLRNIPHPVRAFRIVPDAKQTVPLDRDKGRLRASRVAWMLSGGAVLAAVAALLLWFWYPGHAWRDALTTAPAAEKFDAAVVPLVDDNARRALADYPSKPDFKALAISADGFGLEVAASDLETAKQNAQQRCRMSAGPGVDPANRAVCKLYAVGPDVVWSKDSLPLPAAGDLHTEPLDDPLVAAEIPMLNPARQSNIEQRYLKWADHRALAVATGRYYMTGGRPDRAEAARLAVQRCGDFHQVACLILSVDGFLTIKIPKSHRVVAVFMPGTEKQMSEADRERIGRIYQGPEWRALARGGNGGWYAVAGAPSEAAAADAALESCAKSEVQCRLYAIGNYQVADEK